MPDGKPVGPNTTFAASGVSTMGRAYDSVRGYFGSGQSPYTYGY